MTNLRIAKKEDKELYKNLFNILHNDISPYNNELQEVDKQGYFDSKTVDVYFQNNESVMPFIITADNKTAGAVVLTTKPYVKDGCDYCIQELIVLSLYRGKKIAAEACDIIFKKYRGRYCVIVLKENLRAIKFWDKLIAKNSYLGSEDLDDKSFVYEFQIK